MPNYLCLHFTNSFVKAFFGELYNGRDMLTVSWDEDCDIRLTPSSCGMADVRRQLPDCWEPNQIWVWTPEFHASPHGLFEERIPIIGLVSDWNLGFDSINKTIGAYDHVFTDRAGTKLLRSLGHRNVSYAPLYSFDPSIHRPLPESGKDIDISIVANLNHEVQTERAYWLMRLCELRKEGWNVKIFTHVYGEAYNEILNRSKIVFNRAIRSEMNLRAYEAPAAGALLMNEDGNGEIEDRLRPFIDYVPYSEQNYRELLRHYLTEEAEREAVASSGCDIITTSCRYTDHIKGMIRQLEQLDLEPSRHKKKDNQIRQTLRAEVLQAYNANTGASLQIIDRLLSRRLAISPIDNDAWWLNARACARMLIWQRNPATAQEKALLLSESMKEWQMASRIDQHYVMPHFNMLYFMLKAGRFEAVKSLFAEFEARCAAAVPGSFDGLYGPLVFDDFRVERERILSMQQIDTVATSQLCSLLLSEAYFYKGNAHKALQEEESTAEAFRKSILLRASNSDSRYALAMTAFRMEHWNEAMELLRVTLRYTPFHFHAVLELCGLLAATGDTLSAKQLAENYLYVIDAIPAYEKWRDKLRIF